MLPQGIAPEKPSRRCPPRPLSRKEKTIPDSPLASAVQRTGDGPLPLSHLPGDEHNAGALEWSDAHVNAYFAREKCRRCVSGSRYYGEKDVLKAPQTRPAEHRISDRIPPPQFERLHHTRNPPQEYGGSNSPDVLKGVNH